MYSAFLTKALGTNVPEPEVVHLTPPAIVELPSKITPPESAQIAISVPALTVGLGVIRILIVSLTARQVPLPVVTPAILTKPAVISAADGK
ncbi:hypothetical protein [Cytophaga hutchinsonii]|uniref:hypothetical protein n=1 Tax=Cytophaga hutchinsonii TaxID=985 RepID=UPI00210F0C94|nr:hypothetical protein [Cytophaga hutchinsonii]